MINSPRLFCLIIIFIILIGFLTYSCTDGERKSGKMITNSSDTSLTNTKVYVDLVKLLDQQNHLSPTTIQVTYDHYFKAPKKYEGYYVKTIIDSVARVHHFDTTNALIVFECTDGYQPAMNYSKLVGSAKGYFAYKELDEDSNINNQSRVGFEPYYLVWDNVNKNDDSYIWPYGIVGLTLISKDDYYKLIAPVGELALNKGYDLFINNCIKCHSINKTGGNKGPEFNVPKNITEYWKDEDIIAFANNSRAYRYNSKMPPITNLSHADFVEILGYLKYMKNHKSQN